MAIDNDEASFSFNWLALKLLGRGLYSNPWSALSELVANGLDARASNVYVFVDARNKARATVEVIDDGTGMSRQDINTYVKVGHNKRQDPRLAGASDIKGRKGIGKLAALFLSQHFYLATRHAGETTMWELDARDDKIVDDERPKLVAVDSVPETSNDKLWGETPSGTRIVLLDVDLTGYGPQSIKALSSRLANQFLLSDSKPPRVLMAVLLEGDAESVPFAPVQKSVAYRNLAEVATNFSAGSSRPVDFDVVNRTLQIPAKDLPGGIYEHAPKVVSFPAPIPDDEAWREIQDRVDLEKRTYDGVHYSLTGWIGVHATIDAEAAKVNDDRFVKNKYYNPAQIRVYVRGKLASDRLLSQLGLTGTYANYIEGEVSFDLLDDDSLPDIATSNRQDFDETDGRVTLLRALVRPIARMLMQGRQGIAAAMAAQASKEKDRKATASKRQFADQLQADFDQYSDIPVSTKDELQLIITNRVKGTLEFKPHFRVFISHSKKDKIFAAFIDDVLRHRGAKDDEIFFTSRSGSVELALDDRALATLIKENITDANTLIFYLTSKNFLKSQYCLFEGGAGWATRGVSEYLKLNVDWDSIPKFLTNGRSEVTILDEDEIRLTPELHNFLIEGIFNPMIAHINRGRDVAGEVQLEPFVRNIPPAALELRESGKTAADYFEEAISRHWHKLVQPDVPGYLKKYQK